MRVGEETRVWLHTNKWAMLEVSLTFMGTLLVNVYNLSEYSEDWNLQGLNWQLPDSINLHGCTCFYAAGFVRKWKGINPTYAGFAIEGHLNYNKILWDVNMKLILCRLSSQSKATPPKSQTQLQFCIWEAQTVSATWCFLYRGRAL